MARVKQTARKYPSGKTLPRTKAEVVAIAKAEVKRHNDRIDDIFKSLPRISVPAGQIPPPPKHATKTKAVLKSSLAKKKEMMHQHIPTLETIAKRKKGYKILLKDPTTDVVTILCNCAKNLLKGNAKLNKSQMNKLAHDKENIRALAQPGQSLVNKKKIIRKGGFLPLLAAGALGALAPTLLGGLFGGR